MGTIGRFEEIEAWKKSRELSRCVYLATGRKIFDGDQSLRIQMRRCVVSMMSNIAEGFERGGNNEFFQYLSQAKGSYGELRSQLYIALDNGCIDQEEFDRLCSMAVEISRMTAGLMSYVRQSDIRGPKYKLRDPKRPSKSQP